MKLYLVLCGAIFILSFCNAVVCNVLPIKFNRGNLSASYTLEMDSERVVLSDPQIVSFHKNLLLLHNNTDLWLKRSEPDSNGMSNFHKINYITDIGNLQIKNLKATVWHKFIIIAVAFDNFCHIYVTESNKLNEALSAIDKIGIKADRHLNMEFFTHNSKLYLIFAEHMSSHTGNLVIYLWSDTYFTLIENKMVSNQINSLAVVDDQTANTDDNPKILIGYCAKMQSDSGCTSSVQIYRLDKHGRLVLTKYFDVNPNGDQLHDQLNIEDNYFVVCTTNVSVTVCNLFQWHRQSLIELNSVELPDKVYTNENERASSYVGLTPVDNFQLTVDRSLRNQLNAKLMMPDTKNRSTLIMISHWNNTVAVLLTGSHSLQIVLIRLWQPDDVTLTVSATHAENGRTQFLPNCIDRMRNLYKERRQFILQMMEPYASIEQKTKRPSSMLANGQLINTRTVINAGNLKYVHIQPETNGRKIVLLRSTSNLSAMIDSVKQRVANMTAKLEFHMHSTSRLTRKRRQNDNDQLTVRSIKVRSMRMSNVTFLAGVLLKNRSSTGEFHKIHTPWFIAEKLSITNNINRVETINQHRIQSCVHLTHRTPIGGNKMFTKSIETLALSVGPHQFGKKPVNSPIQMIDLNVRALNVRGHINNLPWNEFRSTTATNRAHTIVINNGSLLLHSPIAIENLLTNTFNRQSVDNDWLTVNSPQIIWASGGIRQFYTVTMSAASINGLSFNSDDIAVTSKQTLLLTSPIKVHHLNVNHRLTVLETVDDVNESLTPLRHIKNRSYRNDIDSPIDLMQVYTGKLRIRGNLVVQKMLTSTDAQLHIGHNHTVDGHTFFTEIVNHYWTVSTNQHSLATSVRFNTTQNVIEMNVRHINGHPFDWYLIDTPFRKQPDVDDNGHYAHVTHLIFDQLRIAGSVKMIQNSDRNFITRLHILNRQAIRRGDRAIVYGRKWFNAQILCDHFNTELINGNSVTYLVHRAQSKHNFVGQLKIENRLTIKNSTVNLTQAQSDLIVLVLNNQNLNDYFTQAVIGVSNNNSTIHLNNVAFVNHVNISDLLVETINNKSVHQIIETVNRFDGRLQTIFVNGNVEFFRPLNVQRLNTVNNLNEYLSLVLPITRPDLIAQIGGKKTFQNGLHIHGNLKCTQLSDIALNEMRQFALSKSFIDQTITGQWHIAENIVYTPVINMKQSQHNAKLDGVPLKELIDRSVYAQIELKGLLNVDQLTVERSAVGIFNNERLCNLNEAISALRRPLYNTKWHSIEIAQNCEWPVLHSDNQESSTISDIIKYGVNSLSIDNSVQYIFGDVRFQNRIQFNYVRAPDFINGHISMATLFSDSLRRNQPNFTVSNDIQTITAVKYFQSPIVSRSVMANSVQQTNTHHSSNKCLINNVQLDQLKSNIITANNPIIKDRKVFVQPVIVHSVVNNLADILLFNDNLNGHRLLNETNTPEISLPIVFAKEFDLSSSTNINMINGIYIDQFLNDRVRLFGPTQEIRGNFNAEALQIVGNNTRLSTINNIKVDNCIFMYDTKLQNILSTKIIKNTIHLIGPSSVTILNDIDMINICQRTVLTVHAANAKPIKQISVIGRDHTILTRGINLGENCKLNSVQLMQNRYVAHINATIHNNDLLQSINNFRPPTYTSTIQLDFIDSFNIDTVTTEFLRTLDNETFELKFTFTVNEIGHNCQKELLYNIYLMRNGFRLLLHPIQHRVIAITENIVVKTWLDNGCDLQMTGKQNVSTLTYRIGNETKPINLQYRIVDAFTLLNATDPIPSRSQMIVMLLTDNLRHHQIVVVNGVHEFVKHSKKYTENMRLLKFTNTLFMIKQAHRLRLVNANLDTLESIHGNFDELHILADAVAAVALHSGQFQCRWFVASSQPDRLSFYRGCWLANTHNAGHIKIELHSVIGTEEKIHHLQSIYFNETHMVLVTLETGHFIVYDYHKEMNTWRTTTQGYFDNCKRIEPFVYRNKLYLLLFGTIERAGLLSVHKT